MKGLVLTMLIISSSIQLSQAQGNATHQEVLDALKAYSQFSKEGGNEGADATGPYFVPFKNCFFNIKSDENIFEIFIAGDYKAPEETWDGETGSTTFKGIEIHKGTDFNGFNVIDNLGVRTQIKFQENGKLYLSVTNYDSFWDYDAFTCIFDKR